RTFCWHSRKQSAVQGPRVLALGVAGELVDAGAWLRTRPGPGGSVACLGRTFRPVVDANVKSVQRFAPNRGGEFSVSRRAPRVQALLPGLSAIFRAASGFPVEGGGVAMRGLMSRVAAATGAAVILLAAGAPVTAGVRALSPVTPGSGWSITPTPNPRAGNGVLNA